MKRVDTLITVVFAAALTISSALGVFAQTQDIPSDKTRQRLATQSPQQEKKDSKSGSQKPAQTTPPAERLEPDDTSRMPSDVPDETRANRQEQINEESEVVRQYNNFFNTYRLGPDDVISISVFGQERYSRNGVTIPPNGRISLALIPDGIFVNGKTVEEVANLIKKRYDEYIIDPQVSVALERAASYRYSILGDVAAPGVKLMTRRMTVTEAIAEAGGVLQTGNKSKVVVLRRQSNGNLATIPVNVSAIYKSRAPDTTFLVPGDQIMVPGNKWKTFQKILSFAQVLSFARVFGVPF